MVQAALIGILLGLIAAAITSALGGCSQQLPSRPLSQIDVQGHMPACPAGHEVQICGIFGPQYQAQCWVEGCDAR